MIMRFLSLKSINIHLDDIWFHQYGATPHFDFWLISTYIQIMRALIQYWSKKNVFSHNFQVRRRENYLFRPTTPNSVYQNINLPNYTRIFMCYSLIAMTFNIARTVDVVVELRQTWNTQPNSSLLPSVIVYSHKFRGYSCFLCLS